MRQREVVRAGFVQGFVAGECCTELVKLLIIHKNYLYLSMKICLFSKEDKRYNNNIICYTCYLASVYM